MGKKTRNSSKTPERSKSESLEYHKGINRELKKRITNLEKRMQEMESSMSKLREYFPKKAGEIKQDDARQSINKRLNPSYKEDK